MNEEIAKLQSQIDLLSNEFLTARSKIRKLESRTAWQRPNVATLIVLIAATALFISSWTAKASSGNGMSSLSPDVATKVKAPFEVVDEQGKTIFRVVEGDDNGARGAFVYSRSGKPVIDLAAPKSGGGGGRIRVTSEDDEKSFVTMLSVGNVTEIGVTRENKKAVTIGTEDGKNAGMVKVFRDDGSKPAVTLESQADGGMLNVFGSSDKPVATLQSDAGEGKLSVNDKGGKPVALVFAKDNGGVVKVMKAGDPTTYSAINAIDAGLGLMVRKAGAKLAFMGSGDGDAGAVYVYSGGDSPVAGISSYSPGKGIVAVYGRTVPIAFLAESDKHAGGGSITATDPAGNGIFSAGYTGEGGDVCIDRKGGLKCLGIGLPLQINP